MSQTKAGRFRELFPEIEKLLETHKYDGVIAHLKNEYNFEITNATLGLYIHRERKRLEAKRRKAEASATARSDEKPEQSKSNITSTDNDQKQTNKPAKSDLLASFDEDLLKSKSLVKDKTEE